MNKVYLVKWDIIGIPGYNENSYQMEQCFVAQSPDKALALWKKQHAGNDVSDGVSIVFHSMTFIGPLDYPHQRVIEDNGPNQ